jgi:hypothetical protein
MQIHLYEVKILQIHNARPEFVLNRYIILGGVFAKNTSLETKCPSPFGSGNFSSLDWYFSQIPLPNMIYLKKRNIDDIKVAPHFQIIFSLFPNGKIPLGQAKISHLSPLFI